MCYLVLKCLVNSTWVVLLYMYMNKCQQVPTVYFTLWFFCGLKKKTHLKEKLIQEDNIPFYYFENSFSKYERGFEPWSSQTNDLKMYTCHFVAR